MISLVPWVPSPKPYPQALPGCSLRLGSATSVLQRGRGWLRPAGSVSLGQADIQPLALRFLASRPYACRVPHFPLPSLELTHDWQRASWAALRAGISAAGPRQREQARPSCCGCEAKGTTAPPSSPMHLLPPTSPSVTLFLLGGGVMGTLLSSSFHLLPFALAQAYSSAPSVPARRLRLMAAERHRLAPWGLHQALWRGFWTCLCMLCQT